MLTPDTAITVRPHISKREDRLAPPVPLHSIRRLGIWDHFGRLLGWKFRFYESVTRGYGAITT
jgi:hypothetical protein